MSLLRFIQRIFFHRATVWGLVVRDIRSRYIGSALGVFWAVVHPVIQLCIYYFVFSMLLRVRIGPEYGGASFAIWLIVGLLPWLFFSEVVGRSPQAVLDHSALVKRTVFPSEVIPFARVLAGALNHLVSLLLVLVIVAFFGHVRWLSTLWIVPYFLAVGVFSLGLSWVLASINVFLRDIGQLVGVVLQVWFYLTPVIYPVGLIPEKFRLWLSVNPLFHAIEGYRVALLADTLPDMGGLVYMLVSAVAVLLVGGWLFRRLKPSFADAL